MCYKNFGGTYTIEQVDCTVYTFALFNHAIQIFDVHSMSVCVFLSPLPFLHTVLLIQKAS